MSPNQFLSINSFNCLKPETPVKSHGCQTSAQLAKPPGTRPHHGGSAEHGALLEKRPQQRNHLKRLTHSHLVREEAARVRCAPGHVPPQTHEQWPSLFTPRLHSVPVHKSLGAHSLFASPRLRAINFVCFKSFTHQSKKHVDYLHLESSLGLSKHVWWCVNTGRPCP